MKNDYENFDDFVKQMVKISKKNDLSFKDTVKAFSIWDNSFFFDGLRDENQNLEKESAASKFEEEEEESGFNRTEEIRETPKAESEIIETVTDSRGRITIPCEFINKIMPLYFSDLYIWYNKRLRRIYLTPSYSYTSFSGSLKNSKEKPIVLFEDRQVSCKKDTPNCAKYAQYTFTFYKKLADIFDVNQYFRTCSVYISKDFDKTIEIQF